MVRVQTVRDGVEVPPSPARPVSLHPFRGLHLSPSGVGDPASARTLARPHRDIEQRVRQWEQRGRLHRDADLSLYLHEYTSEGLTVRGLVGALDLSTRAAAPTQRAVLPHEAVHQQQAQDLAERMDQLGLNPAPILLLHRGTAELRALLDELASNTPLREYDDRAGQHHRVWAATREEHWARVGRELAGTTLLIADGHHRYSAYLRQQQRHPGTGWDRGLVMIVDQTDTPLHLGPIHRTLQGCTLHDLEQAAQVAGAHCSRTTSRDGALDSLRPGTWLATDGTTWITVTDPGHSQGRATVQHLHDVVLPRHPRDYHVHHHHSAEGAMAAARPDAVSVLLPSPEADLLEHSTMRGELLPEKATSFQPKPHVGALMRAPADG